jgi:hypothetical protein
MHPFVHVGSRFNSKDFTGNRRHEDAHLGMSLGMVALLNAYQAEPAEG